MIISVLGTLIDTQKIYEISEVTAWQATGQSRIAGYQFKIYYFNNESKNISTSIYPDALTMSEERIQVKLDKQKAKIDDLHNRIVEVWKGSQGEIPQFEFKNDE